MKSSKTFQVVRLFGFVALFFALALFGGRDASAQVLNNLPPPPAPKPTPPPDLNVNPPKGVDDEVIRVASNLIVVPVSVTDAQGQAVQGLTVKDFRLIEEGQPREIVQLGDPEQVPVELALLVDVSGSTRNRFAFQREAAQRFLRQVLKPTDRATVFAIDSQPRLEQTRTDAAQAAAKLASIEPTTSPTAFYDTVADAARYLARSTPGRHRRVIIAISDGEDTFSENLKTATAALSEVQRADTVFYSINPSGQALRLNLISRRGQSEMEVIANATGGAAFVPEALDDLEGVFNRIAAELRSQYLLEYYTKNQAPPGAFQRIKVQVPQKPELSIRARQGFYNPGK
ncbi:MAG TPA: VWA domain-containing protein [Pyrinomonadaceae bacterium]|nr:VWA domain-containing protein [Pyrinomonadaceae bacterium]